jgi:hypothetical protein
MGNQDNASKVIAIKQRMKACHGIDLDKYIGSVINVWSAGFRSYWKGVKGLDEFSVEIGLNKNFCSDSSIGGSKHPGLSSFREVTRLDSLHIIVSKKYLEMHVDSVSVAAGRDPKSGKCEYDYGAVLDHLTRDLKHWPLIVPSSERGLVIGIRF